MHSDSEPVLTKPAMLFSEITCTYDEDVANLFEAGSKGFQLDPVATANKNDQVEDGAKTDLGITVAVYQKVSDSYVAVTDSDSVVLGEEVKVVFTSASSLLDIHVEDCFAHNNKYKTEEKDGNQVFIMPLEEDKANGFNKLELFDDDCPVTGSKQTIISPTTIDETCTDKECAAFTFNQFAFTDTKTASANPTLSFHMTCIVSIGEAPAKCPKNRRRRSLAGDSEKLEISLNVEGDGFKVKDGIAMRSDSSDSSDMTTLPLLSLFAILLLA